MAKIRYGIVQRVKPGTEETAFYAQKTTYSCIDDAKLIERIRANTAVPSGVIRAAVDAIWDTVFNFVVNGHSVQFGDFMNLRPSLKCRMKFEGRTITEDLLKEINNVKSYGLLGSQELHLMIRVSWRPSIREMQKPQYYEFTQDSPTP